ncbi:MAG: hypothetical protein J5527_00535 [Treponema sp.]|nr:hypothetical protein [Treponema sp.]
MLKSNCKKSFMLICSLIMINSAFIYAQESEQNTTSTEDFTVEKGWSFMSALSLKLSPVIENQPDDGNGGNHFAPIKGINIPVPYGQFVAIYIIPLDFGDNIIFSGANIQLVAGPTITPVGIDTQAGIIFTPSPIINFGLAATAGTGWAIGPSHGIGLYNFSTNKYEQSTPFTVWKYDFIFQTKFQFDFGILIPGDWTHIVIQAAEQLYYEGNTAAKKFQPWEWSGSVDNVNGFQQAGSALLGYMFPEKVFRLIGLGLGWQGHLSGKDYGIYDSNFNGSFKNLFACLQAMLQFDDNNQLAISAACNGVRAFTEKYEPTDSCITKRASGREWYFDGITVQWAYTF